MKRVLVIEDDEDTNQLMTFLLRAAQFEVVGVLSGAEGIQSYHESRPDVVILDIGMPDYNGYIIVAHLKRIDPSARVIALTAYTTAIDRDTALAAGFTV